jgi:hypothetical protein
MVSPFSSVIYVKKIKIISSTNNASSTISNKVYPEVNY